MGAVSVTSKGQVTIPKTLRKALGIGAGSKVEFTQDGKSARLTVVRAREPARIDEGYGLLKYHGPRVKIEDIDGAKALARLQRKARR